MRCIDYAQDIDRQNKCATHGTDRGMYACLFAFAIFKVHRVSRRNSMRLKFWLISFNGCNKLL